MRARHDQPCKWRGWSAYARAVPRDRAQKLLSLIKVSPRMNDLFSEAIRIEASDLAHFAKLPDQAKTSIPVRLGQQIIGRARAWRREYGGIEIELKGCQSAGDVRQTLNLRSFTSRQQGNRITCTKCPDCKKLKKRLFFGVGGSGVFGKRKFVCRDCWAKTRSNLSPPLTPKAAAFGRVPASRERSAPPIAL